MRRWIVVSDHEEREILLNEIERLLKDANNRELNFVYTMLLNMR